MSAGCLQTQAWISGCDSENDIDWDVVLAAVGSHHLKFGDQGFAEEIPNEAVRLCLDHDDFRNELLPLISERMGLTGAPAFPAQKYWGLRGRH